LEDVIELLIVEELAAGHPGWRAAVDEHRNEWHEIQLKTAVRKYDKWAAEALKELNYDAQPPHDR
jgi:hypothetical protein